MRSTRIFATSPSPRLRVVLALVPCLLGVFIAGLYLAYMQTGESLAKPFQDALWYQAAAVRLNIGHDLYRLVPGDPPVLFVQGVTAPLLSPPPIAVIWRPIVLLPFGFAAWMAACWLAVLGTTFYLVYRTGLPGAFVATILAPAIGEQLAAGNVAAFFPGLMVLAWKLRDRELAGVAVGVMAVTKLSPASLGGWLVGSRRWRAVASAVVTIGAILVITILGAGLTSFREYLDVATSTAPSTASLSGLTGIPWLSEATLVVGTLVALALGRWPRWAFTLAVLVSIIGTPSLYLSGWVALLAILAPFSDGPPVDESLSQVVA
ncbi:MAG TPA: glycosyltransferase 87 family protein [Candidatus Limnocylindrales bacterium]|jgi:hypothetical protein